MSDKDANELTQRMRDKMDKTITAAGAVARSQAEAATDTATEHAETKARNAADAADAAAGEFPAGSMQEQAARHVSAGLHDVADILRGTDFDRAAGAVTRFARENPMVFLGGAALLGFAATRFLKASDPNPQSAAPQDAADPWTGHVTATPVESFSGSRGSVQNGRATS